MDNAGFGCFHGSRKRDRAARPADGDGKCFPFLAILDQSLKEEVTIGRIDDCIDNGRSL
jgi:hypothetical protein